MSHFSNPRPLVLTMGEPAGIGPELILKAWAERGADDHPFFAIADLDWMKAVNRLSDSPLSIQSITDPDQVNHVFKDALPVMDQPLKNRPQFGKPDAGNAEAVTASIRRATEMAISNAVSGVVTLPIHKATLYQGGFKHPGHTEFLASLSGANVTPVMMLANKFLKAVPVTIHVSLSQAIKDLTTDAIVEKSWITHREMQTCFNISEPRLAIAGLNPHAGENGTMGDEETGIIVPAIEQLKQRGCVVTGPYPPDTLFTEQNRPTYDVAICMYHDQALIPVKALDFSGGVNVTLGLPFIRTSPDHGTATDIAGKNICDSDSIKAAIRMAAMMAGNIKK